MPRPKGSKNKANSKPWRDALRKALHDRPDRKGPRNLELVARAAVRAAMEGKSEIIKEIGDRIDGKVPQALVGDAESDAIRVIARIERTVVKP
jgi:hypothetical protein